MSRMDHNLLGWIAALLTPSISLAITIMPFGDSITGGFHGGVDERGSYRQYLEDQLTVLDVDFDFVGNHSRILNGIVDGDYQAVGGYKIETMVEEFGSAIYQHQPDFLLILAGTNNHWNEPDYESFLERYESLVQLANTHSPDSELIFATVPPIGCCWLEKEYWTIDFVTDRNETRIPNMNAALQAVGERHSNVTVVDYHATVDVTMDLTNDQIHPNANGQRKLGQAFLSALGDLRYGLVGADNIDNLTDHISNHIDSRRGDLNGDEIIDRNDRDYLITEIVGTKVGDANLDGQFDSDDLLAVFKVGEYEDDVAGNSGWSDGDWNGDREFDASDLIYAFLDGVNETAQLQVVPESGVNRPELLLLLIIAAWTRAARERQSKTLKLDAVP